MTYSLTLLSTEFAKVKNSFVIWITIVGSLCIPLLLFLAFAIETQQFISKPNVNPWEDFLIRASNGCCFFAQITAVLMIGLIINIEHDANGWKHMFVMPQRRAPLFFNKLAVIIVSIITFISLYFAFTLLFGYSLSLYRVELQFSQYDPGFVVLFSFIFKFIISLMGIVSIQYWLSFRLRNMAAALTVGILCLCLGLLLKKWDYAVFFPYASPFLMLNYGVNPSQILESYHWTSIWSFLVFTGLGYCDFTKRFNGH